MNHGARPLALDPRDYSYLRTFKPSFGAVVPIPNEINVDAGFPQPNQNIPNKLFGLPAMPYGCTNYATCGVCGDEDAIQYNPGFTEALTHANAAGGYDIRLSLLTAVKTGVQALGETPDQAKNHKRAAIFRVGQNPDFFDGIRTVLADNKRPLSVGSPWFPEWEVDLEQHIAQDFVYDGNAAHYPWHNFEIAKATAYDTKGKLIRKGEIFLAIKSWQGENCYDKGLLYFNRALTNKVFAIFGSGIFTVAKALPGQIETVGETYLFVKDLAYRQTDPAVAELQKSLKSLGYPIPDGPTTFFGNQTVAALAQFQKDHGIEDNGTHFGTITRSALNALQNPGQSLVGETDLLTKIFAPMLTWIMEFFAELFGWPVEHDDMPAAPPANEVATTTPVAITPPAPAPEPAPAPADRTTNQDRLYAVAAEYLGRPMKLDPSVPNLFGCASSLSGVMVKAGIEGLPALGIAGTNALNAWLAANAQFTRVSQPQPGDIIISPSPLSPQPNTLAHGHCGVVAKNGICSNDSDTGLWRESWSLSAWLDYYSNSGRLPTFYYRWITR